MGRRHKNPFRTGFRDRTLAHWRTKLVVHPPGQNGEPLRLVLEPTAPPNGKPPVRIFIGTEPRQLRAERVLIWSIARHRDPGRAYEIHLMKNIKGIERPRWATGFSHYRYAIPTWAGGAGKAIYNDVDQIYLADPAELFDIDLGEKGVGAINDSETSVMLIDCAKMAPHWNLDRVKAGDGHKEFRASAKAAGLWGHIPAAWNARDGEIPIPQTKLIHYTTLHTQPWKPFPEVLRYRESPTAGPWYEAEAEANAAGFLVFTKAKPSVRYGELLEQYRLMHGFEATEAAGSEKAEYFAGRTLKKSFAPIGALVREAGAHDILDYGAGKGKLHAPWPGAPEGSRYRSQPDWGGVKIICYDPGYPPFAEPFEGQADGVISTDVVEHIPVDDVPWIVDEMFGHARKFVYVVAASYPAIKTLPNGENAHCTIMPPIWWRQVFDIAAAKYPQVEWMMCCEQKGRFGTIRTLYRGKGGKSERA